jgi:hypothetical protein
VLSRGGFEAFADPVVKVCGVAVTVFVDQSEYIVDYTVQAGMPAGLLGQFFV